MFTVNEHINSQYCIYILQNSAKIIYAREIFNFFFRMVRFLTFKQFIRILPEFSLSVKYIAKEIDKFGLDMATKKINCILQ